MADEKKAERPRIKNRLRDLDAAIDAQSAGKPSVPPPAADKRLKDNQSTDKNNSGY